MKRLIVILLTLAMCVAVVIGCGTPTTTPAPTTATAPKPAASPTTTAAPAPTTAKPAPTTAPTAPITKPAPAPASVTPTYGGTLRFIQAAGPGTPIGWPAEAAGGSWVAAQICIFPLLDEEFNGDLNPLIAESYDVNTSADKPSITFHLKKNVKFHDGSPLNAQIVKWNYDNLKVGTLTSSSAAWKSIEVLDDYTVRINLFQWQNGAVRSFGGPAGSLVSRQAFDTKGLDYMRWNMVGTGAFKQVSFTRDVELKLTRFDDFCIPGRPYLQNLNIVYVADEMTRIALFKSGGADVLALGGNNKFAKELQDAGYIILASSGGTSMLIPDSMNKDSIWANPKIRMAAEYAIDKEGLSKAFGYGFWETAYQMPSKDAKAYVPTIAGRKFDTAKAKQLLSEAGYPNGFKSTIIAASTQNKDIPVAIQAQLKAIGIDIDIQFAESTKYAGYQMGTWKDALLLADVTYRANYNAVLSQFFATTSPWYKSMKKPDGWDAMLNASLVSPAQDAKLLGKCIQALYDDATVIPLYCPSSTNATTKKVFNTGLGTKGSNTIWDSKNTWMSK